MKLKLKDASDICFAAHPSQDLLQANRSGFFFSKHGEVKQPRNKVLGVIPFHDCILAADTYNTEYKEICVMQTQNVVFFFDTASVDQLL